MSGDEEKQSQSVPQQIEIEVAAANASIRLDRYLTDHPDINFTRSRLQKLITDGLVRVNGEITPKRYRVKDGDTITVAIPPPRPTTIEGENIPLDIVYQDQYLAVVNKPSGMVTHPAPGNYSGTLVNAMIHHFGKLSNMGGPDRPGIVHRLDKNTSGLLIVARNDETCLNLQSAVQDRKIKRTYLALVCGHMREDSGRVDLPVGRSLKDRKKMSVTNHHSREAQTDYRLLDRFRSYDLLEVNLLTGRTHQIRVHFSHLGHPVFGDPDYGGRHKWHRGIFAPERQLAKCLLEIMPRQALHAAELEFTHPITGEKLCLRRDPPDDFQHLLETLTEEGR
ncbi:MAG: RluA family pseudouridine synthase [candidate division Zixibacteria bacterium]|nr:RluA family pseudouridine synthase [candidate division Zixibacteria bacterium]